MATTDRAADLNKFADTRQGWRFTVPAGTGGIDRDCFSAFRSVNPCTGCGCVVKYTDAHGQWCLSCGKGG